ncbi:MAG: 3-dehydroquinate synthase [Bacteroidales bacterium]|nr:3-dehydroquinate synthase [Bacteroidales bacterium]
MIETIEINVNEGSSSIIFDSAWGRVSSLLPEDADIVIITDDNVRRIYGSSFPDYPVLSVAPGEESKSLAIVGKLIEDLLQLGIDREGFILAIGGGVVCDLAGFLASVYMRGVRFGFISTTLLSQVDASTGGKNGVNSANAKNIIGVFNQPEFVICDSALLLTLTDEEYRSGLAELVKSALVRDKKLFEKIESDSSKLIDRDLPTLSEFVSEAVKIKASIVREDMREAGLRRLLNFGHTFGHGAEMEYGILHGQAVAWGMQAAMELSCIRGLLKRESKDRIDNLFSTLNILPPDPIDGEIIAGRIIYDKKRSGEEINFVFLREPGSAFSEKVSIRELAAFILKYK